MSGIILNFTTTNGSDDDSEPNTITGTSVILSIATVLISAFITFVNILTIVVIRRTPALRTLSNMYVTSLAMSDLVVGLSLIPLSLFYIPPTRTQLFDQNIRFCVLVFGVIMGVVVVSNINMTLIAADRYVYITRPYAYKRFVNKKGVFILLSCAWGFGVIYAILPQLTHNKSEICDSTLVFPVWYLFYTNLTLYSLLVAVDLILYSQILRVAYRQQRVIGATLSIPPPASSTEPGKPAQACQPQTKTPPSSADIPCHGVPSLYTQHSPLQKSLSKDDIFIAQRKSNLTTKFEEITGSCAVNVNKFQEINSYINNTPQKTLTIRPCCKGGSEAEINQQKNTEKSSPGNGNSRMKSVKFFMTVFGAYFVCLTPTIVCMSLDYYLTVPKFLYNTFVLLALLNSGINFVIYMTLNARFKISVFRFLGLSKVNSNDMSDLTNFDA